MSDFLTSLLGGPGEVKSSGGTWADRAWEIILGGAQSKSGQSITVKNALRVSVALACCRVLAEGIAQMPFKLMLESSDGSVREPAKGHPLYRILSRRPNSWQTSFEWRELMLYHAILCKGGFSIINRVRGNVAELLPVLPDRVRIEQLPDFAMRYWVRLADGSEAPFEQSQMFHLRGPSWNGIEGMEILDLAREALGLAIATEETHALFHKNGAKTSGLVSMDGELKEDGRKRLKDALAEATSGGNSFKTLVLDQGAKFHQMSMSGVDAEHIRTREMQIAEICRFFRIYPQKIGHAGNASTYAATQRFSIDHVIDSLGPWVRRFEEASDRDFLSESDHAKGHYCKLDVRGLMMGDSTERANYYTRLYNVGALNPNEIRSLEDRNPYEGGEKYRVPLNMEDPNAPPDAAEVTTESPPTKRAFFTPEGNDMQIKESPATKHLARPFELKELKEDGSFSGYGSIFGNVDLGSDIVEKGAFKRSLAEHKAAKTMPKLLWQHDTRQPIGIYTVMAEDEKGLYVEGQLALKTAQGAEAYELLKLGALGGLSIGYRVKTYEYDTETYVRTLTDVDLWECSLVTFAMNPEAQVSAVKGANLTEREFEQLLTRDAGFTRSQAIAIINDGFKSLKTTRDAGLSLHELLDGMKATNQQIANLK